MILKTVGIRVRVVGAEHVHPKQAAVYAANHSHCDLCALAILHRLLPRRFRRQKEDNME